MIAKEFTCKYLLPCGHCDKFDKICDQNKPLTIKGVPLTKDEDNIKEILDTQTETAICIHDWIPMNTINTAGYVYRCRKCGSMKTEPITMGLQEYTTTSGNEELNKKYGLWNSDSSNPCEHCPNNPKNGGSGVCHCTLGLPKVTCTTLGTITAEGPSSDYPFSMEPSCSTTQYKTDCYAGSTYTAGPSISTNEYNQNVKVNFDAEPQIFVTGMCTEDDLKNKETIQATTTTNTTSKDFIKANTKTTTKKRNYL